MNKDPWEDVTVSEGTLFCAFRYALGRMTYVVSEVADDIRRNRHLLSSKITARIILEIDEAAAEGRLGMDIDRDDWEKLRSELE